MQVLIDANKLAIYLNDIALSISGQLSKLETYDTLQSVMEIILEQPKVDAVEVVRCKDCKHRGDYNCPMYWEELVEIEDDGYRDIDWYEHDNTEDDGFCDRGERKEVIENDT